MSNSHELHFLPLTPTTWPLFEELFGPERGADSGCWCMWWRVSRSMFSAMGKDARKAGLRKLCASGEPPGILATCDGQAVGWCAVAPRHAYPVLQRSRVAAPIGDLPIDKTWFISCLYVRVAFRRRGLTGHLIRAATAPRSGSRSVVCRGLSDGVRASICRTFRRHFGDVPAIRLHRDHSPFPKAPFDALDGSKATPQGETGTLIC
jgi:GNAT superfamily N-acetyltransferase